LTFHLDGFHIRFTSVSTSVASTRLILADCDLQQQQRLVVYSQNSSGIKCTPLSGRFGQIGYNYKLQDSAKMCAQYQNARSLPDPHWGLCHHTPLQVHAPTLATSSHPSTPQLQTTSDAPGPPYDTFLGQTCMGVRTYGQIGSADPLEKWVTN